MNLEPLLSELESDSESVRIYAAEDLGDLNEGAAVVPLFERLEREPSRKVREAIFSALEKIDYPEVIERAAQLLGSEDAFLRNLSVLLLQSKGSSIVPALISRMRNGDEDLRKFILDAVFTIPGEEANVIFELAMEDTDINVLITAIDHIGSQHRRVFKGRVEEILAAATNPMLVTVALNALVSIGDGKSMEVIEGRYERLGTIPPHEVLFYLQALVRLGTRDSLPSFSRILRECGDRNLEDFTCALDQFQGRHPGTEVPEDLLGLLENMLSIFEGVPDESENQQAAYEICRLLGGFAWSVRLQERLLKAVGSQQARIRKGAVEGLRRFNSSNVERLIKETIQLQRESNPSNLCVLDEMNSSI